MKPIYKKMLVILSLFVVMAFFGVFVFRKLIYLWYIWNVILAIMPLGLTYVIKKQFAKKTASKVLVGILLVVWLLFLPNTFYVFTDFIHISDLSFYSNAQYAQNVTKYTTSISPWYELFITILAFLISLMSGIISTLVIANIARQRFKLNKQIFIIIISILCAYGIYIGRFLRINSWDVLNPVKLITTLLSNLDLFTLEFTILMSVFIWLCLVVCNSAKDSILSRDKEEKAVSKQ